MATLKTPVTSQDHIQGPENAPATLLEYGDYECPHCGHAHSVVRRVQKHFGEGLRFVFRNFPLRQSHPHAESAAEAAEFAGANGKFWEMHDGLFENQQRLGMPLFLELAQGLALPGAGLQEALREGTYKERVRTDFSSGVRSGVNGTPTFFINGKRHDGPADYESLILAIEEASGESGKAISA
ncbi:MAG: DsbA family protein [Terriglobales bacterium]